MRKTDTAGMADGRRSAELMIRLMHMLSVLAVIAACGMLALCAIQWYGPHKGLTLPAPTEIALRPRGGEAEPESRVPPLLAAAQGFASYLSPPAPVRERAIAQEAPKPVVPVVRPPTTASPKFSVLGTICAGPSERSIALIRESGTGDVTRWVKEGTQVGHSVIHEIRPGSVVYRDGEKLCEMAIERKAVPTAMAAGEGPATPSVSQATVSTVRPAQVPSRPKRPPTGSSFTVGSARTATPN